MKASVLPGILIVSLVVNIAHAELPDVESLTANTAWQPQNQSQQDFDQTDTFAYPAAAEPYLPANSDAENAFIEDADEAINANPLMTLFEKVNALQEELQNLRGKIEEQNHKIDTMHQAQRDLYLDMDKRLREDTPQKVGGLSSLSIAEIDDTTKPLYAGKLDAQVATQIEQPINQIATVKQTEQFNVEHTVQDRLRQEKAYQQAYGYIQSRDYESALSAFKSLVKTYPNGDYAANAHYWMGEIYMVQGELELAANAFELVYQNFPAHAKAADALLKLGYVEYSKGQWKRSSEILSKVKSEFPGSSSARLATTRLQRMHQEGRI